VVYSQNFVAGIYMEDSFETDKEKVFITLFAIQKTGISKCEIGSYYPSTLFSDASKNYWDSPKFLINPKQKEVTMSLDIHENLGLPQDCTISIKRSVKFFAVKVGLIK
jgi:hypothetical protein